MGRGDELEVLVPLGDEDPPPPATTPVVARRRWRWPITIVAAIAVVVAVAISVRDRLARDELGWLDRQSAQPLADDVARAAAEQRLKAYLAVSNGPADDATVSSGVAALYQEEQQRFDRLRARIHHAVLVDGRLVTVRAALVTELAHRAVLLGADAAFYRHPGAGTAPANATNQTAADSVRVTTALAMAKDAWGAKGPAPPIPARPYGSAQEALERLSRWSDQPTGASLLAWSSTGLVRLDVDASRVTATNVVPDDQAMAPVPRRDYLAFVRGGRAWAVAPDGSGAPRLLASPASYLFAADDPGAVWVVDDSTFAATEVDGTGRVVTGPVRSLGEPVAATRGTLIESPPEVAGVSQAQLLVWSLTARRVTCRITSAIYPSLLGTTGDLVAWSDSTSAVFVTDVTTCAPRQLLTFGVDPAQQPGAVAGVFSPDGRSLAVSAGQYGGNQVPLQVVDVASGHAETVPVSSSTPIEAVTWTPDGSRLFLLFQDPFGTAPLLGTWKVGDRRTSLLRILDADLAPPLVGIP